MRRSVFVLFLLFLGSCAEVAGTGESVAIPRVLFRCTDTAFCLRNVSNARAIVVFTTSGCSAPDFGQAISGSIEDLNCTVTDGCRGEVSSWINTSLMSTSTMPSGVYSICGRIDYNGDYPVSTVGDSTGRLDDVSVGLSTANQYMTSWQDEVSP